MPTSSRKLQLVAAVGLQGLGAVAVLGSNALLLTHYGGALYQKLATLLSIFVAANYFDFGYLGKVRVIAASSQLPPRDKRWLTGRLFMGFNARVLLFEAALLAYVLLTREHSALLLQTTGVLAVAPLIVHVNACRALLEGSDRLLWASALRTGFGVLLGTSPFIAVGLLHDPFGFTWVVATAAVVLIAGFYACAIGADGWRRLAGARPVLPRAGTIAVLETIYVLAGAVFLYGDRYALLFFENSARAGTYIFVLEMVSRASLLYVPIVMQGFPRMVKAMENDPAAAHAQARRLDRKVLAVIGGAMAIGLAAAALLRSHLNPTIDWNLAWVLAVPLAIAYTLNASSYLHQRFTVIAHDRPRAVLAGYVGLLAFTAVSFYVLYVHAGIVGVAVSFLLRTLGENLLLRRVVRHEERRQGHRSAP